MIYIGSEDTNIFNDTYNWFQLYMIYFYSMTLHAAEFSFFRCTVKRIDTYIL